MLASTPPDARFGYVLAHGAGAGMRHPFLEAIAQALFERGVATLRYEFAYMEQHKSRPDPPAVAGARVREAVERAAALGATVLMPAQDQFWGDRTARILDPSGHVWTVASRIEETTEDQRSTRWSDTRDRQSE